MATLSPGDNLSLGKLGYACGKHSSPSGKFQRTSLGNCADFLDCNADSVLSNPHDPIKMSEFAIDAVTGLSMPTLKNFGETYIPSVTFSGAGCHFGRTIANVPRNFTWSAVQMRFVFNHGYQSGWKADYDSSNFFPQPVPGMTATTNLATNGPAFDNATISFSISDPNDPGVNEYNIWIFSSDASYSINPYSSNSGQQAGTSHTEPTPGGLIGGATSGSATHYMLVVRTGSSGNYIVGAKYPNFTLPALITQANTGPLGSQSITISHIPRTSMTSMQISVTFADVFNERIGTINNYGVTITEVVPIDTFGSVPGMDIRICDASMLGSNDGAVFIRPIYRANLEDEPSSWTVALFGPGLGAGSVQTYSGNPGSTPGATFNNLYPGEYVALTRNNDTGVQRIADFDVSTGGGAGDADIGSSVNPDPFNSPPDVLNENLGSGATCDGAGGITP